MTEVSVWVGPAAVPASVPAPVPAPGSVLAHTPAHARAHAPAQAPSRPIPACWDIGPKTTPVSRSPAPTHATAHAIAHALTQVPSRPNPNRTLCHLYPNLNPTRPAQAPALAMVHGLVPAHARAHAPAQDTVRQWPRSPLPGYQQPLHTHTGKSAHPQQYTRREHKGIPQTSAPLPPPLLLVLPPEGAKAKRACTTQVSYPGVGSSDLGPNVLPGFAHDARTKVPIEQAPPLSDPLGGTGGGCLLGWSLV